MKNNVRRNSDAAGKRYFILVMWWVLIFMAFIPLVQAVEIDNMISSGYSDFSVGIYFVAFCSIFIVLSFLPRRRRMYKIFPWLYPLVIMLSSYVIMTTVAVEIVAKGYEVISHSRHVWTIVIMIIQIIVFRLITCVYLYKKPVTDMVVTDFE